MVYCLIGLPINAILIGTLSNYLTKQAKLIVGETTKAGKRILFNMLICTVPGIGMFILLPSALLCLVESDWTYQDSVYYAFINMTHIGFGNLITILRDQAVDTKLGPWMLAYRLVICKVQTDKADWT